MRLEPAERSKAGVAPERHAAAERSAEKEVPELIPGIVDVVQDGQDVVGQAVAPNGRTTFGSWPPW